MRPVIIHYHIFKNAGSTIDSIFKRHFKNAYVSIDGDTPGGTLDSQFLLEYVERHSTINVLSSHQGRLPVPASTFIIFYPILFLRHPIDRIGSVYLFERNQPNHNTALHVKIAKENGLEGYVKWRLSENNGAVIKNFQTIYLSGREKEMRYAKANRVDLEIALERLHTLDFFGIVESFGESITRMKKYLSSDFGEINTYYDIKNKSRGRKNTLVERLEELQNSLSPSLYNELIEKNALDIELYSAALDLFTKKVKGTWNNTK